MNAPLSHAALHNSPRPANGVSTEAAGAGVDPDELHEAAREEAFDEFIEWQRADYERREFEDFGNWLANKARWNRPNSYEVAMTWAERLPGTDLNMLRKGHKAAKAGGWL